MSYWIFIGTLYLIYLTYEDFKHKMKVDDRHNYFMMGATLMLLNLYPAKFFYILAIVTVSALLLMFTSKIKVLGEADQNTLLWSFFGFGIISIGALVWYVLILSILCLTYLVILKRLKLKKAPGYPLFLISFVATGLMYKLY